MSIIFTSYTTLKPHVKVQRSAENIYRKLRDLYREQFEPVRKTMIIAVDEEHDDLVVAIKQMLSRGYDITLNTTRRANTYSQSEYQYIIK